VQEIVNSSAQGNNPVRGCISIEKHVPLHHNPVRGCISIEKHLPLPHNPVRGCVKIRIDKVLFHCEKR
jgi:hypothetical protein